METKLSKCCGAKVKAVGRTMMYYECANCGKACDTIHSPEKTAEEILMKGISQDTVKHFDESEMSKEWVIDAMESYASPYKERVKSLEAQLEQARKEKEELRETMRELCKESYDLMEFCIDRKYLDDEDLTDGQILFNSAMDKARELLTKHPTKLNTQKFDDGLCICTNECLGTCHKDRKCKQLKGYNI